MILNIFKGFLRAQNKFHQAKLCDLVSNDWFARHDSGMGGRSRVGQENEFDENAKVGRMCGKCLLTSAKEKINIFY